MLDDNVPTSSQWRSATTTTAVPARSRPTHHEEASLSWWLSVIACKIHAIKKYMQVIYRIFQAYIKLLFPRQRSNSENCDVHSAYGREVCMLRIMRTAYNCTPTANSKRAAFYLLKSPARGLQHIRYSHSLRAWCVGLLTICHAFFLQVFASPPEIYAAGQPSSLLFASANK